MKGYLGFVLLVTCCSLASSIGVPYGNCNRSNLANSVNDFGYRFVRDIESSVEDHENYFVSPLSVYLALGMVYRGSGGRTAAELESTLSLREHYLLRERLQESIQKYLWSLTSNQDDYDLLTSNSLFLQQDFNVLSKYLEDLHKYYMTEVKLVDFAKNGTNAMNTINKWVSDNTRGKIDSLLSQPLDPSTVLAILNAVYFKGTWKKQFEKENTTDGYFIMPKKVKLTKFMRQEKVDYRYLVDKETNFRFLELPYVGENIVMLLALPNGNDEASYHAKLDMDASMFCRINSSLHLTVMDSVAIPKFQLEYEQELSAVLSRIGIKDLFTGSANLTGITTGRDLRVSKALHKVVVDVNEKGSEAAAITGIIIEVVSVRPQRNFIANRPFLFYIVDRQNGMILFSGRLAEP